MNTTLKTKVEGTADSEPRALLSLEISERGIRRISIYADDGDADQQTAAYALLAKVTPQPTLLQAALKAY